MVITLEITTFTAKKKLEITTIYGFRNYHNLRLKEHQKAVSTLDKGKSALAEHVCYNKHEIAWENSKVITTNNRYGQRLCLEAWHINMSNHALNRDDGAYLPEEYMHLIGR